MNTKQNGFYPRASLAFARKNDAELITFAQGVITSMTDNANFPTPSPSVGDVGKAVSTYERAVVAAANGGKLLIGTRREAREATLGLLRQLAFYVTGSCQEDVLRLQTSGFDAVRSPSPVEPLNAPTNLRLGHTPLSGELLLRFVPAPNARTYGIMTAEAPEGPWVDRGLSTSSRVRLRDFVPGRVYWAKARANGAAGPSDWSGVTSAMAL